MFTSNKGRSISPWRKVRVYRNLLRKGPEGQAVYSVLQDGYVVGYVDEIMVRDARFVVQAAGRDRVRRTGRKVVHAFLEGYVIASHHMDHSVHPSFVRKARYNPYQFDSFVDEYGDGLFKAALAHIGAAGIRYVKQDVEL